MEKENGGGSRWFAGDGSAARGREALVALESRIKPDFKRAVLGGVVAVACLIVGGDLGGVRRVDHLKYLVIGLTVLFAIAGFVTVRSAAKETARIVSPRAGVATAGALRLLISIVGYGLVFLGVLQLANVDLSSFLVGGAVTGVVVGIAAQQSLGNFFAGLVLLFARPFVPGQRVKIRTGGLGGPFEGTILGPGLMYTTILTAEGRVNIPNSGLLAAAIGPVPDPEPVEEDTPAAGVGAHGVESRAGDEPGTAARTGTTLAPGGSVAGGTAGTGG